MTDALQLYIVLGYLALMLGLSWFFYKKPPKTINSIYGYRTNRSMKNQQTWDEANRYSSVFAFKLGLFSFALPFIGYILYPQQNVLVSLIGHSLLLILIIVFTEAHLKARFDQDGNPK